MKKIILGLVLILFSSLASASSKSTAANKFMRSVFNLLRSNKTLLAAFSQRSDITGIKGRRSRPANNGYTKCMIGNPYNTCEATPCSFCKDINIPPKNDNKTKKAS